MIENILKETNVKMNGTIESAKEDFASIRTGRANPALFSKIVVDYYGTPTPLQQLATITAPEPRLIVITPYDKGAVYEVERAIRDSDLGVSPVNEQKMIRVVLPEMTQERRAEYIKLAHTKAEEAKIALRNIRRKSKEDIDKLVKDKSSEVSEDEGFRSEKELDSATKKHVEAIDTLLSAKEKELSSI